MVPQKIKPYFEPIFQKQDGENTLITGMLMCCSSHEFEVSVIGKVKRSMFSKMDLFPENDIIILEAKCKKCGKTISVFDSRSDGYEKSINSGKIYSKIESVICKKCRCNNFCVDIKYEYPDVDELRNLGITEIDNAFTWIWINLLCNECGTRYRNFLDWETA